MAFPNALRLRRRAAAIHLASLAASPALLACGGAAQRASSGGQSVLYVANGAAGTVTRLDAASGHPAGALLPTGRAPWLVAPGQGGALLVLSIAASAADTVTHVLPQGSETRMRSIELAPGQSLVPFSSRIASDAGRHTLVAYRGRKAVASALALLETASGEIVRTFAVGGPFEEVVDLALDDGPAGPVAYVGLWTEERWDDRRRPSGRVVAVDARTGTVLAACRTPGVPGQLVLGDGAGVNRRLYVVAGAPENSDGRRYDGAGLDGGVLDLDALTLAERAVLPMAEPLMCFAVTPGGASAYAISFTPGKLVRLDLATGSLTDLARLPGPGLGLAISGDRLYVPAPERNEVWALDRRHGTLLARIPVGAGPISITGPVGA